MSDRRRIRRPAPQPIPQESTDGETMAGAVVEKTVKVTLDLRASVARRLHSNAYELGRQKGEVASDLLDRGMRPWKIDQKWHSGMPVAQGQEDGVAETLPLKLEGSGKVDEPPLPQVERGRGRAAK